jgi:hypothetical protein
MAMIDVEERRRRLGRRHFLSAPASGPVEVAGALAGLHSSDPTTVFLSVRARRRGFLREELETALYEERSVVRVLGMRRTLFVVPVEMEELLRGGCAERYVDAERRRLEGFLETQHGFDSGWLDDVLARTITALESLGEATARELTKEVPELATKITFGEGKKWGGQMGLSTRVLFLLTTAGSVLRVRPVGSWVSGQYRWAPREQWIGDTPRHRESREARAELMRRWLAGYGPATFEDAKWWSGWGVRDTRAALADVAAEEVETDGGPAFVLSGDTEPTEPGKPWVALLPSLDSTPMGWKERAWYLGDHREDLYDRAGNIGPTIWVDGRIVGGWAQDQGGGVVYELLETTTADERSLIEAEVTALEAWLDGDVVSPRFRTPLEQRLRAES